jgi:hypothetical protein
MAFVFFGRRPRGLLRLRVHVARPGLASQESQASLSPASSADPRGLAPLAATPRATLAHHRHVWDSDLGMVRIDQEGTPGLVLWCRQRGCLQTMDVTGQARLDSLGGS